MRRTKIFTERQFGNLLDRLYPGQLNKFAGWKREITWIITAYIARKLVGGETEWKRS